MKRRLGWSSGHEEPRSKRARHELGFYSGNDDDDAALTVSPIRPTSHSPNGIDADIISESSSSDDNSPGIRLATSSPPPQSIGSAFRQRLHRRYASNRSFSDDDERSFLDPQQQQQQQQAVVDSNNDEEEEEEEEGECWEPALLLDEEIFQSRHAQPMSSPDTGPCFGCSHLGGAARVGIERGVLADLCNALERGRENTSIHDQAVRISQQYEDTIRHPTNRFASSEEERLPPWTPGMVSRHLSEHVSDPRTLTLNLANLHHRLIRTMELNGGLVEASNKRRDRNGNRLRRVPESGVKSLKMLTDGYIKLIRAAQDPKIYAVVEHQRQQSALLNTASLSVYDDLETIERTQRRHTVSTSTQTLALNNEIHERTADRRC